MKSMTEHRLLAELTQTDNISQLLRCPSPGCRRAIIEYAGGIGERRIHPLTDTMLAAITAMGRPVVEAACNHHGGEIYEPAVRSDTV